MSVNVKQTERNPIELYTEWYFNELRDNGYIKAYYREPHKLNVIPKTKLNRYVFTKTLAKVEEFNLLQEDNYVYDYMIVWDKSAEDIFYSLLDGTPIKTNTPFYAFKNQDGAIVSLCDVKPPAQAQRHTAGLSTQYTFPIKQKVLWFNHGIFINKTVPIPLASKGEIKSGGSVALFTTTFCPVRYTFTDGGRQPRKIAFRTRTLQQYIQERQSELRHIYGLLSKNNTLF